MKFNNPHQFQHALTLWITFIVVAIAINGTLSFALGADNHEWVYSPMHNFLSGLVVYGILFTVFPLVIVKGWQTVRQPRFILPLLSAVIALALWNMVRGIAVIGVLVLAYLHWQYDLSELGIRSNGWKGDIAAILLLGLLSVLPSLFRPFAFSSPTNALLAMLDRLFANPASSIENMFYFGFLTERISQKTGKWLTPFLIALMYTAHEMTNPEYWYENVDFVMVYISVMVAAFFYLWRRSAIVIWLGDGLGRFARTLL
jgi:hypothetical protein